MKGCEILYLNTQLLSSVVINESLGHHVEKKLNCMKICKNKTNKSSCEET